MFKVAVIGVIAVFLALPLNKDKQEYAMLVVLSACLIIIGLALSKLDGVFDVINNSKKYLGDNSLYVDILIKMVGITYVAEFGANLCRDAGFGSVANQIEFFGKLMILAVSMPILMTLIETISSL